MTKPAESVIRWDALSEFVATTMGLHFPATRRQDLRRGLAEAAREFGMEDCGACTDWLLSGNASAHQIQVLAQRLTVGETYFFRDEKTLDALAATVLPAVIRARRNGDLRLRLWSAACCTGEEPYSLAILLHRLLPDLRNWDITITATDINQRSLQKAAIASYGQWSFRNAPDWLRPRYFEASGGRYVLAPEIRSLVNFRYLNLVEDSYPSPATDTQAMDVILCRNVLMYFTPVQIAAVVDKLHHCLAPDGWLAVGPSEASRTLFPAFKVVNFEGAILFQKGEEPPLSTTPQAQAAPLVEALTDPVARDNLEACPLPACVLPLIDAAPLLKHSQQPPPQSDADEPALWARRLANEGRLDEALAWCERWIAADKLDAAGHYLHAVILLEQGHVHPARISLHKAVYLDSRFVVAHFALATVARELSENSEAEKYFAITQRLLRRYEQHELLPESDGLTAGQLMQTLQIAAAMDTYHES